MTHIKEFFKHNYTGQITKHVEQHLEGEWLTITTTETEFLNDKSQIIQKQTTIEEFRIEDDDKIKTWIAGNSPFEIED